MTFTESLFELSRFEIIASTFGKKADFIVIDKDYFKIEASEIRDIQVLATYVNGNLVYSKN